MSPDETWGILGRRCVEVTRILHQIQGEPPTMGCLLEFTWESGEVTLLQDGWEPTISVSSEPWGDPYARASESQREELAAAVGLWARKKPSEDDALVRVVGERATSIEPFFNQVGQLGGIEIAFESVAVTAVALTEGSLAVDVREL